MFAHIVKKRLEYKKRSDAKMRWSTICFVIVLYFVNLTANIIGNPIIIAWTCGLIWGMILGDILK